MKKILFLSFVLLLSLNACVPEFLSPDTSEEAVDINATVDAEASTQAVQTFDALYTPTMEVPATSSPTDEATATEVPTETEPATEAVATEAVATETATAEATETITGTLATEATSTTPDGTLPVETATATIEATATSIYPSPTSPISINEPPPSVPRHKINVVNKTKGKVYISLQGVTEGDYHPIIEYDIPAHGKVKFKIPEGKYTAIVYVGKDPMIGYFNIRDGNITIIIRRDEIQIKD